MSSIITVYNEAEWMRAEIERHKAAIEYERSGDLKTRTADSKQLAAEIKKLCSALAQASTPTCTFEFVLMSAFGGHGTPAIRITTEAGASIITGHDQTDDSSYASVSFNGYYLYWNL
ncbi:MAG: hypothetical protein CMI52_04150 [Parcubacteria group bacterium]|nr:hypothetical protein [Parcubacteria group bacterium]|tara:strand:- start:124 stop:474 length:351 start_codon:yes stop_codon:yes gene_type:complete